MDDDLKELTKSLAKSFENVTDIFNKIVGPFANEIGEIIGDRMRVYRYQRAIALLEKTKRMLEAAGIEPYQVPISLFLPIIENASIQDNDTLHDRWAALLANAATPNSEILPAFTEILKELSPSEAQFLDTTFDQVVEDQKTAAYPMSIRDDLADSIPRVMLENLYRLRLITRDTLEVVPKTPFRMRAGSLPFFFSDLGRTFVLACRSPKVQEKNSS